MHRMISVFLSAALVVATACGASGKYVWVHDRPVEPVNDRILIGAGDLIEVQVFGDEQSSTTARVLADGTLMIPLIGPVYSVGLRPEELAALLEAQLKRLIATPKGTVVIRESVVSVSVLGEVRSPKAMQLVAPASVLEALAEAGGLTEFADKACIFVLRKRAQGTERIRFSYDALVEAEPAASRFQLKPGDVVVVD
jgi:polysaccharide export outer membrane protein